jgi:hypothetical protein
MRVLRSWHARKFTSSEVMTVIRNWGRTYVHACRPGPISGDLGSVGHSRHPAEISCRLAPAAEATWAGSAPTASARWRPAVAEITRTLQRITRDRTRACCSSPYETQVTTTWPIPCRPGGKKNIV